MNDAGARLDERITRFFKKDGLFVDLGCGSGKHMKYCAYVYGKALGVDIKGARLNPADLADGSWRFIFADMNQGLPIADNVAGMVYSSQVIEHLADPVLYAKEIYRILKPHGSAIILTPNVRYIKHLWHLVVRGYGPRTGCADKCDGEWDNGHIHYFTHRDMTEIFKQAGFNNVTTCAFIDIKKDTWGIRRMLANRPHSSFIKEFLSGNIMLSAEKRTR